MPRLTHKQRGFVEDYAKTHNGTEAALNNYDTDKPSVAAVIANENLKKPKILNALEEALPDDMLMEIHREGLYATKTVFKNNNETKQIEAVAEEADFAVRHKYLDSAYKLKGKYAPEKTVSLVVELEASERTHEAAQLLNEIYRTGSIRSDGAVSSALDNETQD